MKRPTILSIAVLLLGACAGPGGSGVGGADYATAYDFSEFYYVTNDRTFQVIVSGNPFRSMPVEEMKRQILPVMQANRPRPRLTFTYDTPAERPRPWYRMVLVFDSAPDLTAARVCAGETRNKPQPSQRVEVFAVYCRNDEFLSQTTAWTPATGPDDPRFGGMFRQLFLVLFTELPPQRMRLPFNPFFR